jgi:hypothetical protein|tara:strand:+ start:33 stop:1271 length:1239 start_codon:yes stop_codon:yes gene_type:complete
MAKKELVENIVKLYSKLGGNMNDVLGSRSNVTFLGKGSNPEPFIDLDINMEAVGVLGKSKIIQELKSPLGYLTADKLNDVQANKLYNNLLKLDDFYNPKQIANITDMATGTRNLDQEGLMSLRDNVKPIDELQNYTKSEGDIIKDLVDRKFGKGYFDGDAGFETTIRNLETQEAGLGKQFEKIVTNKGDLPSKRASAREFLVETLKVGDDYPSTTLNDVVSAEDMKYILEGGGGLAGDPLILVEKYFGPRISEALPSGATGEEIITFTKKVLTSVEDAKGLKPDEPGFDRMTAKFVDDMADGGRAGFKFGRSAGKAFGLAKKIANINKSVDEGTQMGYGALREYGIEAKDISRLFREIAMDKTMVGAEKTGYFKMLNQVLKNPDDFPDGIIEIKKRLGIDFARGGLAKILEV